MKKAKGKKSAGHTGEYTPGDIQHVNLSTPTSIQDHPARMKPDPQGGGYWGDTNGLGVGVGE